MKKLTFIFALIIGLYTGCDTNITGSGDDPSGGFLERGVGVLAEVESSPPSGTYYNDGSSTSAATGGDDLEDGYSVWNSNGYVFELSVYESTVLGFDEQASVKISNPTDTQYRRTNSTWISITSTATVTADSVRTGTNGTCSTETDVVITVGGDIIED